jgi:hypothetical protein
MQSTLNAKQNDPHDVLEIAPDVVLVAPTDKELSDAARASEPKIRAPGASTVPPVDTTFRATAVNAGKGKDKGKGESPPKGERPSFGTRAARAFRSFMIAVALAVVSGVVAYGWENYGDKAMEIGGTARDMIATWVPQIMPTFTSSERSAPPAPSTAAQASAENTMSAPTPISARGGEGAAVTAGALSPETTQLLQSMARDLATVGQDVAQLRASIEQLKASQDQMARDLAKVRDQARPKVAAAAPPPAPQPQRPTLMQTPARRPMPPPYYPPQAGASPYARALPASQQGAVMPPPQAAPPPPMPLQPEPPPAAQSDDGGPVVRPPMPVR